MIAEYGRQGYISEMIFKRRMASNSKVVLLADRYGSMFAYEYWEKQLTTSFRSIPNCQFEHYCFFNLPKKKEEGAHYLFEDANNIVRQIDSKNNKWTNDTWFFIFSDAGAHSGMVNPDRMEDSIDFWYFLKEYSDHVYWLNPVPEELQNDCSSSRLTFTIPMIYPDKKGLNVLIKQQTNG